MTAAGVWALASTLPSLPSLYVGALPYYELYSYPILHQPLLRTAEQGLPPRVCYVYGIAHGPHETDVNPTTKRICVELAETSEALRLTPTYDQGRTSWELDVMGKELTEKGLPVEPGRTGVDGLEIERVYELPDSEAREDSTLIPT